MLGWVLLLTVLAMVLAGTASYVVQRERIQDRIDGAIAQEIEEFRRLQRTGVDPETGAEFVSMRRLFEVALERNVPDDHQVLLAYAAGRVVTASPAAAAELLLSDAEFAPAVAAFRRPSSDGAAVSISTTRGTVRVDALPVVQNGERGAWVVAYFTGPEQSEFRDVMRTYAVVSVASVLLVAIVGWFVAGALLRPVRLVRQAAQQISETDLTRRIQVTGNDDLSDLARTFNAMLERLETAFLGQRRFLDDAGHELRTPITIVRGHLELLDTADEAEVNETRALVLDELDRMARLVNDLLLLAKSERPDFVRLEDTDVGLLVDEVFDKTRALGPRVWQLDACAEAVAAVDAQRVTQALIELASNAVTSTDPGDTISLGSSIDPASGILRLWVRDTGRGVDPRDAPHVFERFRRGRGDRRADGGAGLGLTIVRAIAEAHGGSVELEPHRGRGSCFSLVLPLRRGATPAPLVAGSSTG